MPNTARILIVEDEYLVAKHLRLALEDDGYEVAGVAASSRQALFVAERERPDLVLMDVHIRGDVDGVATAGILREELGVPVVFLTANADDPTFQRALQVGAGGFLTKPFNAQRVHHAIQVAKLAISSGSTSPRWRSGSARASGASRSRTWSCGVRARSMP